MMSRRILPSCQILSLVLISACTSTRPRKLLENPPLPAPYGLPEARDPAAPKVYKIVGECDGLPRVDVATAPGFCLGLVDKGEGLLFPRGIVKLNADTMAFIDMGGWVPNRGRIFTLKRKPDGKYERKLLVDATKLPPNLKRALDRPNALLLGPDGQSLYIGGATTISRLRHLNANPAATIQILVDKLPDTGRHPLKTLAFDNQRRLYVNIGSWSDNCEDTRGKNPDPRKLCAEGEGREGRGVIRRYSFDARGQVDPNFEIVARGLRNSMALAINSDTNELFQGENSRDRIDQKDPDISDMTEPPDELNLVEEGAHYGWPYCYGNGVASPEYAELDCQRYRSGLLLWPAHAASLSMFFNRDERWPSWYRGKLVVAFHGYREFAHRIVAFDSDGEGRPVGEPLNIVYGWEQKGMQPLGAPTGMALAADGSLFVTEDKNQKILRLFYDPHKGDGLPVRSAQSQGPTPAEQEWRAARTARQAPFEARLRAAEANPTPQNLFTQIQQELIHSSCLNCHGGVNYAVVQLLEFDDIGNARKLLEPRTGAQPLVVPGKPEESEFWLRLEGRGTWQKMPPMGYQNFEEGRRLNDMFRRWIKAGAPIPAP